MTTIESLRRKSFSTLADVIGRKTDEIIAEWVRRSQEEREWTKSTHRDELHNRLPGFLDALADSLRTVAAETGPRVLALEHGEQRWQLGWNLSEVVADYQLLRQILHDHFEADLGESPPKEERQAIDLHIDDAIGAAVVAFTEHQEGQLRQSHQRLTEFLGVLGHELRNPLNAISMGVHVLRRGVGNQEETLGMVHNQIGLMTRLLEDMLDITRITRGQMPLDMRSIDLCSVLRHAEQGVRSIIATKNHSLTLNLPMSPLWIQGDEGRLTQVFSNLLGNAAKYTDAGGQIFLDVEQEGTELVRIRVKDNGKGIDSETLPRVFDLFVQSPDNAGRGLGIGLALARALIEVHGGRIEAHSQGVGQGSEFMVWLPLPSQDAAETSPTTGVTDEELPSAPECRILIVDDDEASSGVLEALLKECGHTTFLAHDGEQGLEVADREKPEVLLLDVGLPKIGGYEVARQLRSQGVCENALVVVMTGYAQQPAKEVLEQAGITQHLVKPVDIATIQKLIAEHRKPDAESAT